MILTVGDSLLMPLLGKPLVRVMAGSALGEALSAKSPLRFLHQLGVYAQELASAATQRNCVGVVQAEMPAIRFPVVGSTNSGELRVIVVPPMTSGFAGSGLK